MIIQLNFDDFRVISSTNGEKVKLVNGTGDAIELQVSIYYPTGAYKLEDGGIINVGGTVFAGSPSTMPAGIYSCFFKVTINIE